MATRRVSGIAGVGDQRHQSIRQRDHDELDGVGQRAIPDAMDGRSHAAVEHGYERHHLGDGNFNFTDDGLQTAPLGTQRYYRLVQISP